MITLTQKAVNKIKSNLETRGQGIGISIGVKTTGCSGLAYVIDYMDKVPVTEDWFKYEHDGATVWINGKDLIYLDGLTMDWIKHGLNERFEFINPNESARCGCGESFTVR